MIVGSSLVKVVQLLCLGFSNVNLKTERIIFPLLFQFQITDIQGGQPCGPASDLFDIFFFNTYIPISIPIPYFKYLTSRVVKLVRGMMPVEPDRPLLKKNADTPVRISGP